MPLEQPWQRVNDPVAIPNPLTTDRLMELPELEFARLLRDHLVPRQPVGQEREHWDQLWLLLRADDTLAGAAFDVLEGFLDEAEAALDSGELPNHSRKRAQRFSHFCEDAWKRLQTDDDKPLGWAGRSAAVFNPPARRVLEQLTAAIAQHRRAVTAVRTPDAADERLWQTLGEVHLDPEAYRRRR